MSTAATTRMTAEQFHEWVNRPENRDRHFELDRGEVVEKSRPTLQHGVVCGNVGWVLSNYVRRRRKGFVCGNDAGIVLERDPDTVRGPDVTLYEGVRTFDELPARPSERLPKLAVEVLSPNDRWGKVTRRINELLSRGVALVWLVDPDSRNVTVHRMNQLPQVAEEGEELTGDGVLPEFRCAVADFFFMPEEAAPAEGGTA
jgi:Uma2 family endonuclease